jgi:hypothetical protein
MTNKQVKRQFDMYALDMPEYLGELMNVRGLYPVLESLAQALLSRADHHRPDLEKPDLSWSVRVLHEEEIEFSEAAARRILGLRDSLAVEWDGRAPMFADGVYQRGGNKRTVEAMRKYFDGLFATLRDPTASDDAKSKARAALIHEGEGTIWIKRDTGKPDFEMAEKFRKITAAINDPEIGEDERTALMECVHDFLFNSCG